MVNYKNGKIYRIVNTQNETVYIGSTCQSLSQRFTRHQYGGNGNKIILIENYPCDSCEELRMREQSVIEDHDGLMNMVRAYESSEQKKERVYKWHQKNSERVKEIKRTYYERNPEKVNKWKKENPERAKEYAKVYWMENKEKLNERKREYREANKDGINKKASEKVLCEICNSQVSKRNLSRHQKSKKCLAYQ
mgnify:CR=1 FL=1